MRILSAATAVIFMLTTLIMLSPAAHAAKVSENEIRQTIDEIFEYKLADCGCTDKQEWIDGYLSDNAGRGAEWYVILLSRSGSYEFSSYCSALGSYLSAKRPASATTRQKCALAFIAAGDRDNAFVGATLTDSIGEQGVMSLIYGLHLLENVSDEQKTAPDVPKAQEVLDKLMSQRHDDGGWSVMGEHGDVDVTAMALQALAPYSENGSYSEEIGAALSFLSEKQESDGGYKGFGNPNPESASQVLIALSSLGIDLTEDERFIKNGNTIYDGIIKYRLPDGSFTHEEGGKVSETATTQALMAFMSYTLLKDGGGRIYELENNSPLSKTADAVRDIYENNADASGNGSFEFTPEAVSKTDYKPAAAAVTAGGAVGVCVLLFVLGKRRMSNFAAVIIAAGAVICFIFFTDFKSAEEYYGEETVKTDPIGTVTLSVRCDTAVSWYADRHEALPEHIPKDGTLLKETELDIERGETVLDILKQAAKRYGIQMQSDAVGYVSGIGYLYEFDYGELSGWIYHVNGDAPFVHCSEYTLSDGDRIEWLYTCELGYDLGDIWVET